MSKGVLSLDAQNSRKNLRSDIAHQSPKPYGDFTAGNESYDGKYRNQINKTPEVGAYYNNNYSSSKGRNYRGNQSDVRIKKQLAQGRFSNDTYNEDLDGSLPIKTDYLAEMREKRRQSKVAMDQSLLDPDATGSHTGRTDTTNQRIVQSLLKDKKLNDFEKIEAVKQKAKQLEQRALEQEKIISLNKKKEGKAVYNEHLLGEEDPNADVERAMAVNDMYIDAIQAKLKILDQL